MNLAIRALSILGAASALSSCARLPVTEGQTPNIIYIMSDDHAYQAISAYGGPLQKLAPTPNIDRIANNGMRFNRCLVTNSISGPCRAVLLTGKYSHLNGFVKNEGQTAFDSSQMTFPKLLQNAGYNTAIIGKWHLGSKPAGFNFWEILPGQGAYYNPNFINKDSTYKENGYVTEIITQKSIKWLKEAKDSGRPFMLMMHHKAPHRNWQPGPHELGMYNNVTFPEPATLFDDYTNRGTAEKSQDMTISRTMRIVEDLKLPDDRLKISSIGLSRFSSEQLAAWDSVYNPVIERFYSSNLQGDELVRYKYQRYLQDYLACIAAVDKSVGEILDFLKENGMDKNTIVIYASDQGFYLGEHGWFDKRFMFEESYRTPFIVEWPGVIDPGGVNNDMVSNIDFAETFLDIAGVDIPSDMQGRSLVPIFMGKTPSDWRKVHYYHYYEYPGSHMVKRHYGISTKRYKLIHYYYDIDEWELYDIEADPLELRNVYDDPDYSGVKRSMHRKLEKTMAKYGDSAESEKSFLPEEK